MVGAGIPLLSVRFMLVWTGHPGDFHEFRVSYLSKWPRFMNRRGRKRLASVIKRGLAKMRRGVMRQLVRPPSPLQAYDSASEADTSISRDTLVVDFLDSPAPTLYFPSPAPTVLPESPVSTRYFPSEEPEQGSRQRFTPETSGVELVPETPPDHYHED